MSRADPKSLVALLNGTPLIIMLDIDGTLCEIVERPDDAAVPPGAIEALNQLNLRRERGIHLAFVTGRSAADARRMIRVEGALIYANHGSERIDPSGHIREPHGWTESRPILAAAARRLRELSHEFPGTSLEDKSYSLSFHFRGMDVARLPELTERVASIINGGSLHVAFGKSVINVVPANAHDKGDAALEIVREFAGDPPAPGASILFMGDDVTDEDAFRALSSTPGAVTVRVAATGGRTLRKPRGDAPEATAARYTVGGIDEVHRLLELLVEARR